MKSNLETKLRIKRFILKFEINLHLIIYRIVINVKNFRNITSEINEMKFFVKKESFLMLFVKF